MGVSNSDERSGRRVGLLTLPLHTNYGGILQAAALYKVLSDLGNEVVLLDRIPATSRKRRLALDVVSRLPFLMWLDRLIAQGRSHRTTSSNPQARSLLTRIENLVEIAARDRRALTHHGFIRKFMPRSAGSLTTSRELSDAVRVNKLDAIVVGSDQVWRASYMPDRSVHDFFLGFDGADGLRKVSYAASFGLGYWQFPEYTSAIKAHLSRFAAVSVREASAVNICRDVFGRPDAQHVLDPTLLVEPDFYDGVAGRRERVQGGVLLDYILDREPGRISVRDGLLKVLGAGYSVKALTLDAGHETIDVPAWVRAFMEADFVVTDSFHGTVFSIIFKKNFVALLNQDRGADRFTSLLDLLGLSKRLVSDGSVERALQIAAQPIDFEPVHTKIVELRRNSHAFLRDALAKVAREVDSPKTVQEYS